MYVRVPDSRVDPGGDTLRTFNRLTTGPLQPAHKQRAAVYTGWSGLDIDAFVYRNCPGSRESWMSGGRDVVGLVFGGAA